MPPQPPTAVFRPRTGDVLAMVGETAIELSVADALAFAGELIGAVRSPHRAAELLTELVLAPELRFSPPLEPR